MCYLSFGPRQSLWSLTKKDLTTSNFNLDLSRFELQELEFCLCNLYGHTHKQELK